MAIAREEINRKLLHIVSGCGIPAGILYIPLIPGAPNFLPVLILGLLLVISLLLEIIRFKFPGFQKTYFSLAGSMLRPEEDKKITGATFIFASAFLCALIFCSRPDISAIVLNLFILGDAVAAVVGLSVGRIKIGKKSLEGSLACFCLCFLLFYCLYPHVPLLLDNWGGRAPLVLVFAVSLSITVLELFPLKLTQTVTVNDNLYVPVVSGLLILLF